MEHEWKLMISKKRDTKHEYIRNHLNCNIVSFSLIFQLHADEHFVLELICHLAEYHKLHKQSKSKLYGSSSDQELDFELVPFFMS